MQRFKLTVEIETRSDPSHILDALIEFGKDFTLDFDLLDETATVEEID